MFQDRAGRAIERPLVRHSWATRSPPQGAGRPLATRRPGPARCESLAQPCRHAARHHHPRGHSRPTADWRARRNRDGWRTMWTRRDSRRSPRSCRGWGTVERLAPAGCCDSSRRRPSARRAAGSSRAAPHRTTTPNARARLAAATAAVKKKSEHTLGEARKHVEQAEAQLKKAWPRAPRRPKSESREIEKEKAAIDRRYETAAAATGEAARQEARGRSRNRPRSSGRSRRRRGTGPRTGAARTRRAVQLGNRPIS